MKVHFEVLISEIFIRHKKSWKVFDQLKNIDQKYYCSDYYDASVKKYGVNVEHG